MQIRVWWEILIGQKIFYKAEKEQSLYQFNADTQTYEKLSDGKGIDDIQIINGGTA